MSATKTRKVSAPSIAKSSSERLQLAQSIAKITSTQDSFAKAVEQMKDFSTEMLKNLDLEIDTKREELQRLENEFNNRMKDEQIKAEQALREFKYRGALEILKETDEVAINSEELAQLREKVSSADQRLQGELEKLRKEEKSSAQAAMSAALTNMNLTHKAEIAKITAENEQRVNDIENFKNTISTLQKEITAQRELTRQVAESSRAAPIAQTFGKA